MRPVIAFAAPVATAAVFVSGVAKAQGDGPVPTRDRPSEAVRLEYRAPSSCQDEAQFFAQARSRAPRMRMARPGERARSFIVEIEQRATGTSGRLTIRDPDGASTARQIEAKDCSEVVDALSLIVALAVSPRAGVEPAEQAPSREQTQVAPSGVTEQPNAHSEPAAPPRRRAAPPPAPRSERSASGASTVDTAPSPSESTAAGKTPRWAFRAGLAGIAIGAIAPEPLYGVRGRAEIAYLASGLWAPSFRLSPAYTTHPGFVVDGGTAHFDYAGAAVAMCPWRFPLAGPLVFRPCLAVDLGIVLARGTDTENGRSVARRWAAVGAGASLEWAFSRRIAVALDVECTFPIWRDRFLFGPRAFHEVAWIGGLTSLGIVVRIP